LNAINPKHYNRDVKFLVKEKHFSLTKWRVVFENNMVVFKNKPSAPIIGRGFAALNPG